MISKLQVKLIFAAMISLLVVLTTIMGVVIGFNYYKVVSDADKTLLILAENDGFFPKDNIMQYNDFKVPKNQAIPPEMPFETRYFFCFLDTNNNILAVNTGKIAAINSQTAIQYTQNVLKNNKTNGFLGNYRYLIYKSDYKNIVLFLDCSRNIDSFKTLRLSSIMVSITGFLLVLILLILLSNRIVKPFSENYEKQKRFITDAGHELKTPLTIINADTEILSMDLGENEWITDIQTQTKRLSELTNDLILLSRMQEDDINFIDFPISDIVEETIQGFKTVAKTQEKTIDIDIQPMLSLYGDESSIRKLVSILLDNAIKYTDLNGKIVCNLKKHKNQILLSVYNTTDNITKEQTKYLFDRFYRTDKSRNSQTGGYGLGLSIAKEVVNKHKGKITANTNDEKSLLITVTFPV